MSEPALTAEQWARLDPNWFQNGEFGGDNYMTYDQRHAMAAKCLQYMPFGFTREDVQALSDVVRVEGPENYRALVDIADRIEALLPPTEGTEGSIG